MHKILIISDDQSLLSATKLMVRGRYDVLTSDDGRTGLALLRDFEKISAVICETQATNMLGVDFLTEAANTAPNAALVMMTDPNRDENPRDAAGRPGHWHTIEKPLMAGEFLSLLDRLVRGNGRLPPDGNSGDQAGGAQRPHCREPTPTRNSA